MFQGDDNHYLRVGLSALDVIEVALAGAEPLTILDLPCGFGRVTRVLRARYPAAAITACDLDRPAVDFTAATFLVRPSYSEPNFRDLRLETSFDLIWVGSLLTHLPEHQTRQFLDFAIRHMGPHTRLVVTSHGGYVVQRLRTLTTYGLSEPAACGLLADYLLQGYGYRGYDGGAEYGISLIAPAWYRALLEGSPLRLQSYHERGWDEHQDVLVLSLAPGAAGGASARPFFDINCITPPLPPEQQAEQDRSGAAYFDEAWYCNTFADVAAAVRAGLFASGHAHFLAHGWREGRPPFDPQRRYQPRMAATALYD